MNSNENETPINVSNEISRDIQNIQNLEPNESNGTSIAATENKINEGYYYIYIMKEKRKVIFVILFYCYLKFIYLNENIYLI